MAIEPSVLQDVGIYGGSGLTIGGGIAYLLHYLITSRGEDDLVRFKTSVWNRMDQIQEEISAHALYDAANYVKREEVTRLEEQIERSVNRIDQKLDQKFDSLTGTIIKVISGHKGG